MLFSIRCGLARQIVFLLGTRHDIRSCHVMSKKQKKTLTQRPLPPRSVRVFFAFSNTGVYVCMLYIIRCEVRYPYSEGNNTTYMWHVTLTHTRTASSGLLYSSHVKQTSSLLCRCRSAPVLMSTSGVWEFGSLGVRFQESWR